jgi:hypothetical protein
MLIEPTGRCSRKCPASCELHLAGNLDERYWLADRFEAHTGADDNVCPSSTHCATLNGGEVLRLGRREERAKLRAERSIGFEDVVFHIERGDLLDILEHPNPDRHAGQRIFDVRRDEYVDLVSFVEDEHTVLHPSGQGPPAGDPATMKTILPSRKATKEYLGEETDDEA